MKKNSSLVAAVLLCYFSTSSHLVFFFSQHALVLSAKTKRVAISHHYTFEQLSVRAMIFKRHPTATVHSQYFLTLVFWRWAFGVGLLALGFWHWSFGIVLLSFVVWLLTFGYVLQEHKTCTYPRCYTKHIQSILNNSHLFKTQTALDLLACYCP